MSPRYYPPGHIVTTFEDPGTGVGVVLSNSRHRKTVTVDEATAILAKEIASDLRVSEAEAWRHVVEHPQESRWFSVTKKDIEWGNVPDECDEGGWCVEGSGQAITDVLTIRTDSINV